MKNLHNKKARRQSGFSLLEMLIALVILAIGLGSLTILFYNAMASNYKSSSDSTATLLAQRVLEALTAQPANATANISMTDCAGNNLTLATTAAAPVATPVGSGAGATLNASGDIDWTQAAAAVPANYSAIYTACGTNANYEIRWNITQISGGNARLVTVGTRSQNGNQLGGIHFALPVSLKSIGGR